ncbi:MAG: OmpA family protein [Polyangiaceae bacterium]|nr:OmpA family protein [Polyangiaceae bacterium]
MVACTRGGKWALALGAALVGVSGSAMAQTPEKTRVGDSNPGGIDTHLFRPALDSKGFFSTNGSDIIGNGDVSFGLVLDYGKNILRTADDTVPVDAMGRPCAKETCMFAAQPGTGTKALARDSFQGTFNFNYGVKNLAVVGVSVPVILMTGDRAYQIGPSNGLYNSAALDAEKIASLALHGKLRILRIQDGIGLAVTAQVGIPVSDSPRDLGGDPGVWYWPQVALEKQFGFSRRFKIGINGGYRGHTGENAVFENDTTGQPQLKEGVLQYGNLATYGAGVSWRAVNALDLVGETYGTFLIGTASDQKQQLSQEAVGGIKLFVEKNSYLMMGAGSKLTKGFETADLRMILGFVFEPSIGDRDGDGYKDDQDACPDNPEDFDDFEDGDGCPDPDNDKDGIPDVDDRCPNVPEDKDGDEDDDGCPESKLVGDRDGDGIADNIDRCPDQAEDRDGFEDKDGCPDPDNDKDGILDVDDQCPDDPEDKDGFEDTDGCPDPDNDKDRILDAQDECPTDPETYNGTDDKDGCPDKGLVVVEGNDIMILQKVQFATGSAKILPASDAILDAVTATLKGHPEFITVEIAGHADERSTDEYNLQLTKARAAAVMQALVGRGIEAKRLVSQGYGEYCPIDDASNEQAWEKNRRVEFKIVKTEDGMSSAPRGCERARGAGVFPPQVQ